MKTLEDAKDREEILARLGRLRADSARRWGKMSVDQMVCHLCDSFRGPMGERAMPPMSGVTARNTVKWVALYVPMRWPHGLKTMPEVDQFAAGTKPTDFARDVEELRRLFARFTRKPRDFAWTPHPFFLDMSEKDWMRWGYLHMDHHLRQFGN
jgi:Protein of unknown function (DUF1569)